ncbi:sigma factor-like helix-turn-helix DNA-binding protein [Bacillus gaemokensis]|uniref:RNA polymerase sigma-70 region 4 domain-containing protein n=1 Tax=Bacillus gaemokensis TaxID=574375 RepID=A0A073KDQ6_9BACI|nr:sigma factor-like helix-turn-helix DNA-binding protein [Bacillus gaemokensis]KEK24725.1 hypothetical protein BAGA_23995 [Bacillus gaemokensis]KYG34548.1 hypothetical protein AZF08_09120 [Bacillus gaemokensis]
MQVSFMQDLEQEIEMLKIQIQDLEIEHKFLIKNMNMTAPKFNGVVNYEKERVLGGKVPLGLDEILIRNNKIADKMHVLTELVKEKQTVMDQGRLVMEKMTDLEKRIMYYRDVKGMNLKQIAELLNYSYDHIRRVSSNMKRWDDQALSMTHK